MSRLAWTVAFFAACSPASPSAATSPAPLPSRGGQQHAAPLPSPMPGATHSPPPAPVAEPADPPPAPGPSIDAETALGVMFPEGAPVTADNRCPPERPDGQRIRCLLALLFDGAPEQAAIATGLYDRGGHVMGLERHWVMDGGFRGTLQLVPERPVGRYARHLAWVAGALDDLAEFFAALQARAPHPIDYRHRALSFRFLRSVGRTTPSAYAEGWTIAYNVTGSLHRNADKVRETLFHELFHLNDEAHGDWTRANLAGPFAEIVGRCGTNRACLQPWAPNQTTVRGGTYYAFQPDNGEAFHEYGAELALRYYREQRTILRGGRDPAPFKCGPAPNARVYELLAGEFFGGADLVPACGR